MTDPWAGELVRLRAFEPDDAATYAEYFNDGEGQRLRGDKFPPYSLASLTGFVNTWAATPPTDDNIRLVIDVGGELVGSLRTFDADVHNGRFSFHVSVSAAHRRKGYGLDGSRVIMRWFFGELRYHKCVQQVFSFNDASIAMHRRLGFTEEGRLREAVFAEGALHDEILFGITAEEFRDR